MLKGFTVSKVAEKLQCHPNTVKRITKRLNLSVRRDYRNYRLYSESHIKMLQSYLNQSRREKFQ